MNAARDQLAHVLREAQARLDRPDNNFDWSAWADADEALNDIAAHLATLESGRLPKKLDLTVLFAATGPIQEVGLSSGWGDEFLRLASRFDAAVRRAYRWDLIASVRTSVIAAYRYSRPR